MKINILNNQLYNNKKTYYTNYPNKLYKQTPISFSSNINNKDRVTLTNVPKLLSAQEGIAYATKYKNATAGYRGEYKKDFNDSFVYTMTHAAGDYMLSIKKTPVAKTIVGGDTREATIKYAPEIADTLNKKGIDVYYPNLRHANPGDISPIASPVSAVATIKLGIPLTVLLTASHNPWKDGGYNFLNEKGMVAEKEQSDAIAKNIINITKSKNFQMSAPERGKLKPFDAYEIYKDYLDEKQLIDFQNIKNSGIEIFYEDFGGTGKYYYPRLMRDHGIQITETLSSKTEGPNPTSLNMTELGKIVKKSTSPLKIGLATDGDSDRFGAVDENGKFIGANDILLLISYHLIKNKGMNKGTIIKNHSTSESIDALARYFNSQKGYDIDISSTPVGFKYLASEMLKLEGTTKEAIVVGEESGGLTIRGHIPEKDGFVAISLLTDLIATEKKPVSEILEDVKSKLAGEFSSECINISFPDEKSKEYTVKAFRKFAYGEKDTLFGLNINKEKTIKHNQKIENLKPGGDGYKIYFDNNSSVLIRKSGTEPIMRYFIDSSNTATHKILKKHLIKFAIKNGGNVET